MNSSMTLGGTAMGAKAIGAKFGLAFAILAILALATGAAYAGQDTIPVIPLSVTSALTRLIPREIQVGPQMGFTGATFMASSDYRALIEPTPATKDNEMDFGIGAMVTARWSHWFTLSLAPHRETYRMDTREGTIAFPGNPFPHTLKASTELAYNVWPLMAGMGWFTSRQHFQIQLGTYKALLDHADIQWTVDGDPYPNTPQVTYRESLSGWTLGTEYGHRLGSGELLVGIETQREYQSMLDGLQGSIRIRSAGIRLGYVWTVLRR